MAEEVKNEELKEENKPEAEVEAEVKKEAEPETKKEKRNKEKEKFDKLEKKYLDDIKKLEEDNKNLRNEYLKCLAEVENTKRRLKEESIKDRKYASQKVVGELINPIDMLVKIIDMPASSPEVQNYQIGFKMIANQLVDILKAEGLAPVKALGEKFNPAFMQAVETKEDSEKDDEIVLSVMQEGYMYKDRVLRPAMVVVNKKNVEKKEED